MNSSLLICLALLVIQYCRGFVNECHDGEINYIPGENYIKSNCTQQCTCSEVRHKGHLESCVPLCQLLPAKCLSGTKPELYQEEVIGSHCKCSKWRCVNVSCSVNNAIYAVGDVFIRDDCSERCRCDAKNVTNTEIVCQPLCKTRVTCPTGFKQNESLDFIPGSNCTCRSTSCVPDIAGVEKIGCYGDTWTRALPLFKQLSWATTTTELLENVRRCRNEVRQKGGLAAGYKYFGVQYWSQCFYGNENDPRTRPFRYGKKTCPNKIHGGAWTNMIYEITSNNPATTPIS